MPDTLVKAADYAARLTEVKSRIQSARISVYSQPEFLRQAVAELNQRRSVPSVDEKWRQAVAKLNRLGVMEFLEQAVPEMRGKFPTSRAVIPAKAESRRLTVGCRIKSGMTKAER